MVKRLQDRSTIDSHDWKTRVRREIAHRAGYRCEKCHAFCGMHGHVDHRISRAQCKTQGLSPWARGNLQYLCPPCHNAKSIAERWEGHQRRERSGEIRRSRVPGRAAFLQALADGIAINCKSEVKP